jgi:hypothetical protein
MVDTFSVAADIALRDAAAVRASDEAKSILADIGGCASTKSYGEVSTLFAFIGDI